MAAGSRTRTRSCTNPDGPQNAIICPTDRASQSVDCELTPGSITLRIDGEFDEALNDPDSPAFKTMTTRLLNQLDEIKKDQDTETQALLAAILESLKIKNAVKSADGEGYDLVVEYEEHKPTNSIQDKATKVS